MIDIDAYYGRPSGPDSKDCHALGYRTARGQAFEVGRGDSWIIEAHGTQIFTVLSKTGWFTGIWRSSEGHTYVTDISGMVHHRPANRGEPWPFHPVRGALMGVFGIDDRNVFAWGLRGKDDFMVRWDGQAWKDMPSPQGGIIAIHGTAPDSLYAVGERGMAARFDGDRWQAMTTDVGENLASVFVAGDDEVWAAGHRGTLLRGSADGWETVLTHPGGALTSVAKHGGTLFVATTTPAGLCRLVDEGRPSLSSVKAGFVGGELDTRGALVLATPGFLASSPDGVDFLGFPAKVFRDLVARHPVDWA